jgi:hypothetical protein
LSNFPEFSPHVEENMTVAIERLSASYGLLKDLALFQAVSLKVIELAAVGVTEPDDICARVVSDFKLSRE